MAALYAEGRIDKAFEAGKKAADYAIKGTMDVHMRDAAIKCVLEVNAVVSKHEDELKGKKTKGQAPPSNLPEEMEADDDPKKAGKELNDLISEAQAKIPKTGDDEEVDVKELDPATIMLLVQIGSMAFSFLRKFWR